VCDSVFIQKHEWNNIMTYQRRTWNCESYHSVMYEFVIRKNSKTSPLFEVNIFGFIKDIRIRRIMDYNRMVASFENSGNDYEYDWQDFHEYVFVADVFTPTVFYIATYGNNKSYGSYNMDEGTITTHELLIPFSEIRRLYRICGHERSNI